MSLTAQLREGKLGRWCAERFTGSRSAAEQVVTMARGHRPVFPTGSPDGRHWAAIGGAFGIRLAALIQPAPPYYALQGLVNAGLVGPGWANEQAGLYPTHACLAPSDRRRAMDFRPTVEGWLDLAPEFASGAGGADAASIAADMLGPVLNRRHFPAEPVLGDLFHRARAYFAANAPPGEVGTPGAEAGLARICWLFEMFEDVYRSGRIDESMHQIFRPGVPTVERMRSAATAPVVTEMVALARQLKEGYSGVRNVTRSLSFPAACRHKMMTCSRKD